MNGFNFIDNWQLFSSSVTYSFASGGAATGAFTLTSDFKIGAGGPGIIFIATTGTGATGSAMNLVSVQVVAYPFSSGQSFSGQGAAAVFNTTSQASANAGLVWTNKLSSNAIGGHAQWGAFRITQSASQTGSATLTATIGFGCIATAN